MRSECDFCEGHPGEADGLSWDELAGRFPTPDGWDPDDSPIAGWETWREMGSRVRGALEALVARHAGETVVVACHGGVVVWSMMHWLALGEVPIDQRAWMSPENASLTEWRCASNPYLKGTLPLELVRYNDHAHLG